MSAQVTGLQPGVKLCVGASSGGHTNELMRLLEAATWWPAPAVAVTTLEILRPQFEELGPTTVIGEAHRYKPWAAVGVFVNAFRFAWKERPDVMVTTGSLPLAMVAFFVKIFGGKVVWIDSIAQMEKLSMSGSVVRRFADRCYAQWPQVADQHDNVTYAGELL
jgi:beta-1,4-N-acetylglucosaminyltransferase